MQEAGARPLFTVSFGMAIAAVHCYFVSYVMSLVQVPMSLEGEPDWAVGLIVGGLGIAGMLTRPLVGVWVDRGNRQRWLRLGAAGTVIAFAGYAAGLGPWVTLGFRALHGVSMGLFTTALLAIVTSVMPPHRRGLGVGIYQSSNTLANLYAAIVAVFLVQSGSLALAFGVSGAAAALALVFGSLAGDPGNAGRLPRAPGVGPGRRQWVSRSALVPAMVFLGVTTAMGTVTAFLPLFATERSLGNVGLFYSALAATQLLTRSSAGWISDRFGRAAVVTPSLLCASAGMLLLSSAREPWMLMAAAALFGLGLAATQTTIVALIVDRAPPDALGSAMATYTIAWDVGAVVGSVLLGVVANATSYATVFALCAAFPLAGLALFELRLRAVVGAPGRPPAPVA